MTIREIKVPKVPARAFDKNRKPSDLIMRQLEHLQHVVERRPDGAALAAAARRVRTEGQAAAFIGRATALLQGAPEPAPAAPPARAPKRRPSAPKRRRAAARSPRK